VTFVVKGNTMKNFAVLGLGQFGSSIALCLMDLDCEVLAIDKDPERIEEIKDSVTMAVIGNVADRATFDKLISQDIDCLIIGLGENLQDSVLTALYAAETGIDTIIAKASTKDHGKILELLGTTRVVYPSSEIAKRLATSLVNPNLLDYLPIHEGYSLTEIVLPEPFENKTLRELDIQKKYGIMVIAIKGDVTMGTEEGTVSLDSIRMFPSPDKKLKRNSVLVVVGKDEDINKLDF